MMSTSWTAKNDSAWTMPVTCLVYKKCLFLTAGYWIWAFPGHSPDPPWQLRSIEHEAIVFHRDNPAGSWGSLSDRDLSDRDPVFPPDSAWFLWAPWSLQWSSDPVKKKKKLQQLLHAELPISSNCCWFVEPQVQTMCGKFQNYVQ